MTVQIDLAGWNGSAFDLRNGPVRIGNEGTRGILGMIKATAATRQAAGRDGQTVTGISFGAGTASVPIKWGGYTSEAFESVDSRFWAAMRPGKVNTLRVRDSVRGTDRSVGVRLDDDGYSFTDDPTDMQIDSTVLSLVMDDPWWKGLPISTVFGVPGVATPFYGPTGSGPLFYISAANAIGQQQVTNPGDVVAYPLWTLAGPLTAFSLSVDGNVLDYTAPNLLAGEVIYIDNDPTVLRAWRVKTDGTIVEETQNLNTWGFTGIQAGATSTVVANTSGSGSATLRLVPRYYSANR